MIFSENLWLLITVLGVIGILLLYSGVFAGKLKLTIIGGLLCLAFTLTVFFAIAVHPSHAIITWDNQGMMHFNWDKIWFY